MVTIPTKLKQFLILSITFGIVYWFQIVDDKKRCKERIGIYEKIKLPLLVSSIIGLVLFWDNDKILNIFVTTECNEIKLPAHEIINAPNGLNGLNGPNGLNAPNGPNVHTMTNIDRFGTRAPDFDVYTSMPEW